MARKPSLDELQRYPGMVRWFNPDLLMKLLWQGIVSGLSARRHEPVAGGEGPALPHCEHREDATQRIRRGEHHAEIFVTGACVEGEADGGQCDRQQHRTPPRNARDIGVCRAIIGRHRRPCALC